MVVLIFFFLVYLTSKRRRRKSIITTTSPALDHIDTAAPPVLPARYGRNEKDPLPSRWLPVPVPVLYFSVEAKSFAVLFFRPCRRQLRRMLSVATARTFFFACTKNPLLVCVCAVKWKSSQWTTFALVLRAAAVRTCWRRKCPYRPRPIPQWTPSD